MEDERRKRSPAAKSVNRFVSRPHPTPALGTQCTGVLGSTLSTFTLPDLRGGYITKLPRLTFEFVILLPPPSEQLGSRPVPSSAPFQHSAFSPRTLNSVLSAYFFVLMPSRSNGGARNTG